MNLLRNAKTLLTNRRIARDYIDYWDGKLRNAGRPVKKFPGGIRISGLSGFSEFHACGDVVSPQEWTFFRSYEFGSGDILDVGANLGVVTAILAQRFPDRIVHAFEPNPSAYQALGENIALNDLENVRTRNLAVCAHRGTVAFDTNEVQRGTTRIATGTVPGRATIACTTLDDYAQEEGIDRIALLKVDVEGFEPLVFEGARELLSGQRIGLIYFEVCPGMSHEAGFEPTAAAALLQGHGYALHSLGDDGEIAPIELAAMDSVHLDNWVAIPETGPK